MNKISLNGLDGFVTNFNSKSISDWNGNFSVLERHQDGSSTAVTDRFNSREIFFDTRRKELLRQKDIKTSLYEIDDVSTIQLLFFQRLYGNRTMFKELHTLPAASNFTISKEGNCKTESYFNLKFNIDDKMSFSDCAHTLANLLQKSVREYTEDCGDYGLLLSGGLDSRAVLGALSQKERLKTYTIGDTKNNEYLIAKKLSELCNFDNEFIQRSSDYYGKNFQRAISCGLGKNVYYHGHFFLLDNFKDVTFIHGHGLDYFFQGSYLPTNRRKVLGINSLIYDLDESLERNLNEDAFIDYYIKTLKFRLKGPDVLDYCKESDKEYVYSTLKDTIRVQISSLSGQFNNYYELWELLNYQDLSKHYTNLNLMSMRDAANERTIAFHNELLDFFLTVPHKYKLNGRLLVEAIKILNPELAHYKNANTNLRASIHPLNFTFRKGVNKILSKFSSKLDHNPKQEDRSWPAKEGYFNQLSLENKLEENGRLGFLDYGKISTSNNYSLLNTVAHINSI